MGISGRKNRRNSQQRVATLIKTIPSFSLSCLDSPKTFTTASKTDAGSATDPISESKDPKNLIPIKSSDTGEVQSSQSKSNLPFAPAIMSLEDQAISSAMIEEEKRMKKTRISTTVKKKRNPAKIIDGENFKKIKALVDASMIYSQVLSTKIEGEQLSLPIRGPEHTKDDKDNTSTVAGSRNLRPAEQPRTMTGGIMRPYQLQGLSWLKSLFENGLNGILADEMGLGKTIQTIALLAFLREMGIFGPFLVVAPLSTLGNWIDEFSLWAPSIPKMLYHGTPNQRKELREKYLSISDRSDQFPVVCTSYEICINDQKFLNKRKWKYLIIDEGHRLKNKDCRLIRELKQYGDPDDPPNRLLITGTPLQNDMSELWSLLNYLMPEYFANQQEFDSLFDFSDIVDDTGDKNTLANDQKRKFVVALHAILKPFLLRRVKSDVESDLPKKREYILYAPLTDQQQTLYNRIREGTSRSFLEEQVADRLRKIDTSGQSRSSSLKRKSGGGAETPNKSVKSSRASTPGSRSSVKKRQAAKRKSYKEPEDDELLSDDAFEQKLLDTTEESDEFDEEEQERERDIKTLELARKEIARKKLQNPAMQLRLACNSPHNFYWPWGDSIPDKTLVNSSGKLLMLDRLVPYLFEKGHKILIFSQFKTQLDILESWAALINGWQVCRIDGGVKQEDRRSQIHNFNTNPEVRLFLLSTRAGGQGINLTAADTVILFDSDWNPQQDLQAQDRVHRIGQTRPVIVYRLATKHTIEDELLRKADGKRRLEKIVIQKGKFLFRYRTNDGNDEDEELGNVFDDAGFETYDLGQSAEQMLSEEDLMIITDRSNAAYERAEKGLDAGEKFRAVETKKGSDGLLGELDIR